MVCDSLENLGKYRGLGRNFGTAIDFLQKTDLSALPLGKTEIDGKRVIVHIQEAESHPLTAESYELHHKYFDIQLDLSGTEEIAFSVSGTEPLEAYREDADYQLVRANTDVRCTLGPGRFAVCMVGEPHAPCGCCGKPEKLRKCLVKIARDDL